MRQITSVLGLLNLSVFFKSHLFLLPVLYLFYTSCGITLADFFLIQGISSLTCLLLDVPMGYIADRVSKKKILICSNLVLVLRFLLLYFFPTKEIIFLFTFSYNSPCTSSPRHRYTLRSGREQSHEEKADPPSNHGSQEDCT